MKSHGRMLWEFANGITHSKVEKEQTQAKGIGNSTTLSQDVVSEEEAQKVLLMLAESVGARLRKSKAAGGDGQCGNQICYISKCFSSEAA